MLHNKDDGLSIMKQLSPNALSFTENICSSNCTNSNMTIFFFRGGGGGGDSAPLTYRTARKRWRQK